ncbi:FAD-linked oxidoreductase chyH [Apiospora aurea]|uniref:FAD-linked oxidoreductase chyH n=1 Tax=Apiospora aurea TaxID=335848 RepID=A0ABR1QPV2_9PEZI
MPQFKWMVAALSVSFAAVASLDISAFSPRSAEILPQVNYTALAEQLSKTASIYWPGSGDFEDIVACWSNLSVPVANIVVVPGIEEDVVQIVNFANEHSVPFLATNGFHGAITTLGEMSHGIEIYLSRLNTVEILQDGLTAKIGGGIRAKNLIDALWDAGKQTVTGACECVGYLGPGLGGGHGWLQGHHGIISDQYLSSHVVLANGSLVNIDETSDLFWGMKGAGHNFDIVTSVTSNIYDLEVIGDALQVPEVLRLPFQVTEAPGGAYAVGGVLDELLLTLLTGKPTYLAPLGTVLDVLFPFGLSLTAAGAVQSEAPLDHAAAFHGFKHLDDLVW